MQHKFEELNEKTKQQIKKMNEIQLHPGKHTLYFASYTLNWKKILEW